MSEAEVMRAIEKELERLQHQYSQLLAKLERIEAIGRQVDKDTQWWKNENH